MSPNLACGKLLINVFGDPVIHKFIGQWGQLCTPIEWVDNEEFKLFVDVFGDPVILIPQITWGQHFLP